MSGDREEAVLALKELLRQWKRLCDTEGSDAVSRVTSSPEFQAQEILIKRFTAGEISTEEMEQEGARFDELFRQRARQRGDPATIMALDAEDEASASNLAPAAQLLLSDAIKSAGNGFSTEQWIADVLIGHAGDDSAQLGCLRHIVALWSGGGWPWPRDI